MTGYPKRRRTNWIFSLLLAGCLIAGCEKEEPPIVIVAKVGDEILTDEELDSLLSFSKNKGKYREEVIRNWVDSELLFLEASHNEITKSKKYMDLVHESDKSLANSLYLSEFLNSQEIKVDEQVLLEFFNNNKNDFSISAEAFVYNKAVFSDESKAILFRTTLIESDWNKANNVFSGDGTLLFTVSNQFEYARTVLNKKVRIVLDNIEIGEVSIIFETEHQQYNIVQLVSKYEPGAVPDFDYIKKNVVNMYMSMQKTKIYEALLQDLYTKYDVIINR